MVVCRQPEAAYPGDALRRQDATLPRLRLPNVVTHSHALSHDVTHDVALDVTHDDVALNVSHDVTFVGVERQAESGSRHPTPEADQMQQLLVFLFR